MKGDLTVLFFNDKLTCKLLISMTTVQIKTNHNVRIVNLVTGDNVICIFGQMTDPDNEQQIIGYRMVYPFRLKLGTVNEDKTIPINYERWCPFSPVEEHRLSGDHIISAVYPDSNILDSFVKRLGEIGITEDQIFIPEEELDNGDNSEPDQAAE